MKLFVYGTLRLDQRNYEKYLQNKATYLETKTLPGKLFRLKGIDYPGMIESLESRVVGDVFEIDESLLPALDELEEYYGKDHPNNLYDRVEIEGLQAYLLSKNHYDLLESEIKSGDYLINL